MRLADPKGVPDSCTTKATGSAITPMRGVPHRTLLLLGLSKMEEGEREEELSVLEDSICEGLEARVMVLKAAIEASSEIAHTTSPSLSGTTTILGS